MELDASSSTTSKELIRRRRIRRQTLSLTSIIELHAEAPRGHLWVSSLPEPSPHTAIFIPELLSSLTKLKALMRTTAFQRDLELKMAACHLPKVDAELEVLVDCLVAHCGAVDSALVRAMHFAANELLADRLCLVLLQRGALTTASDEGQRSALHWAVARSFLEPTRRLLEESACTVAPDTRGDSAIRLAVKANHDALLALLIRHTPHEVVLKLCSRQDDRPPEVNAYQLLKGGLKSACMAVLDRAMYEVGVHGALRVHYEVLETDSSGRLPGHPKFAWYRCTVLHLIAQKKANDLAYHELVRLLVDRKWRCYARSFFIFQALLYSVSLIAFTAAIITASHFSEDPTVYKTNMDYLRLACECVVVTYSFVQFAIEFIKAARQGGEFFLELTNLVEVIISISIFAVVLCRFLFPTQQWGVAAVSYLLWNFRIFKYACVFRRSGAYIEILWRILAKDFPPFLALFVVFLVAFSGSLLLSFRGEGVIAVVAKNTTQSSPDFWSLAFQFLRIAVEGETSMEYTAYRILSLFLVFIYLCVCLVVLMNVLIAQLSDTYNSVYMDAQRGFELNRAWIVSRIDLNALFLSKALRELFYLPVDYVENPWHFFAKWETPMMQQLTQKVQEVESKIDDLNIDIRRLGFQQTNSEKMLQEVLAILDDLKRGKAKSSQESSPPDSLGGVVLRSS